MKLHEIKPAPGSRKRKKRKGLGISAGQGKTAGRGQKGQASRSGGTKKASFEGGTATLMRKLPFARGVGFSNPYKIVYAPVNVGTLAARFASGADVTPATLVEAGLTHASDSHIAILGDGEILFPLKVTAHKISKAAQEKIEKAGGSVTKLEVKRGGYRVR